MRIRIGIFSLLIFLFSLMIVATGPSSDVNAGEHFREMPQFAGATIYFTESSSEASRFDRTSNGLSRLAGLLSRQGAKLKTLETRANIPPDTDLIIIAGPLDEFDADQTARLWAYLNNNGRILLLAEPPIFTSRGRTLAVDNGLFSLTWADMGFRGMNEVVVTESGEADSNGETTSSDGDSQTIVSTQTGLTTDFFTSNINSDHVINADSVDELAFFGARPLEVDASIQIFEATPLVFSETNYYGESRFDLYLAEGVVEFNIREDTTRGPLPLVVAFQNDQTGTRMITIGDREFATNGGGLQTSPPNSASFIYPNNARFLLNAAAWLLEQEPADFVFPTPGPTATPTPVPTPQIFNTDLEITISSNTTSASEGDVVALTIAARNNGPDNVTNVSVMDILPEELIYVSSNVTSRDSSYDDQIDEWLITALNVDAEETLTLIARVDSVTEGQTIDVTVSITGQNLADTNDANNEASSSITVGAS